MCFMVFSSLLNAKLVNVKYTKYMHTASFSIIRILSSYDNPDYKIRQNDLKHKQRIVLRMWKKYIKNRIKSTTSSEIGQDY